jgi:serpin B
MRERGTAFTAALLRAFAHEKGNVFFSGESLRLGLGMAALGARGKTADEIASVLGTDPDPAASGAAAKAMRDAFARAAGHAELSIASRVWVDRSVALDPGFLSHTQSDYGAPATSVDFAHALGPTRAQIDAWVAEATKNKIRELFGQGGLEARTRVVLTNAVYFKGRWATPFSPKSTRQEPFASDVGNVSVPMMHHTAQMAFADKGDVRCVELPYEGSDLAMLIVLPQKAEALGAIERAVTAEELRAWGRDLHPARLDFSMPKFTIRWGRPIEHELAAMGMPTAFTDAADFTGMTADGKQLKIDSVVHKAFVAVDEEGTEAAAATGMAMTTKALVLPIEFKVDRPFLVFVRNAKTGDLLFAGRIAHPQG